VDINDIRPVPPSHPAKQPGATQPVPGPKAQRDARPKARARTPVASPGFKFQGIAALNKDRINGPAKTPEAPIERVDHLPHPTSAPAIGNDQEARWNGICIISRTQTS
jgi:hypothetical protein